MRKTILSWCLMATVALIASACSTTSTPATGSGMAIIHDGDREFYNENGPIGTGTESTDGTGAATVDGDVTGNETGIDGDTGTTVNDNDSTEEETGTTETSDGDSETAGETAETVETTESDGDTGTSADGDTDTQSDGDSESAGETGESTEANEVDGDSESPESEVGNESESETEAVVDLCAGVVCHEDDLPCTTVACDPADGHCYGYPIKEGEQCVEGVGAACESGACVLHSGCDMTVFDDNGRIMTLVYDFNCDSEYDQCERLVWDSSGCNIELIVDDQCDNVIDSCSHNTCDQDGRYLTQQIDSAGGTCDGTPDYCHNFTYGFNDDGVWQITHTASWTCTGSCDALWVTLYDQSGDGYIYKTDNNCDGTFDVCQRMINNIVEEVPCPVPLPVWPQDGFDAGHSGQSPYVGPNNPVQRWVFNTPDLDGGAVIRTPVVGSDGAIFYALEGVGGERRHTAAIVAVNPDGTRRWVVAGFLAYFGGVTPLAITDRGDVLYSANGSPEVVALNPATGEVRWAAECLVSSLARNYLTVSGEMLFVLSDTGGDDSAVSAFSTQDGSKLWQRSLTRLVGSPVVVVADNIYYAVGDRVEALNKYDGSLQWSVNIGPNDITLPLVADPTGRIHLIASIFPVTGWHQDTIVTIDTATRVVENRRDLGLVIGFGALSVDSHGILFVSYNDSLMSIDLLQATEWTVSLGVGATTTLAKPVIASDGAIYLDRKSTRLNSSHSDRSRMPSSA